MSNFSTFWHGKKMSLFHMAALSSFVKMGHSVKVYAYDKSIEVPEGVTKEDANKIILDKTIKMYSQNIAAYSDIFRYNMIQQTGEMWVDADTFCLSSSFFDNDKYVFIRQSTRVFSNGILKMPKESEALNYLCKFSNEVSLRKSIETWGEMGPKLLSKVVKKFELEKYGIDGKMVNLIDINTEDPKKYWLNPDFKEEMLFRMRHAKSATFFNSDLTRRGIDTNFAPPGSAIEFLVNKFMLK